MTYVKPHMRQKLAGHVLTVLTDTPEVSVYRLGRVFGGWAVDTEGVDRTLLERHGF